jgi:hypothetical protein
MSETAGCAFSNCVEPVNAAHRRLSKWPAEHLEAVGRIGH